MTAPSYLASLNGRQQVTFAVGGPGQPAAVYPGTIASATWRMQVRSSATPNGTLLLDSQVGGTWSYVGGAAPSVTFQWPTSAAALVPPGSAAFDVLFIFPGADAELATAGSVAFTHGVTQAGVSGSPTAPIGADDTWTLVGTPVAPTSPSLASAVASANSSAAVAASANVAAAASQTAAVASQTAAAASQTAAAAYAAAAALSAGIGVAANVAGLAALDPSLGTAILIQSGRFGYFNWVSGNRGTQVTNDPGQGVTVAWSGDSAPGATGAWVRQWEDSVDWTWWGAVPDCTYIQDVNWNSTSVAGTDNYNAFVSWQTWARYQSTLGLGVKVKPSPGCYGWNQRGVLAGSVGGLYWTSGISRLRIDGRGMVTLQAMTSGGFSFPIPAIASFTGYLIAQTTKGAFSFTLLTPSNAGNFAVGQWIMLGSLDVQYLGFPSNLQQYQYVQVTSSNATTGVVAVSRAIKDQHRTDYPDYSYSGTPCGAARAWVIGQGLGTNWDIEHIYEGIQVNLAPSGAPGYVQLCGRSIKTIDWVGVGFSETCAGQVVHEHASPKTAGETDKLVEYIRHDDPNFQNTELLLQSSCPRHLVVRGGNLGGLVGTCQQLEVEGCDIVGPISISCQYGMNLSTNFNSCRIGGGTFQAVTDGTWINTIDGSAVAYANGAFIINTTAVGYGINAWGVVPGMGIALQAKSSGSYPGSPLYPGDIGFGYVLSLSYSAGVLTINTSLPYAALPSWATGKLLLFKCGPATMRNCTGNAFVRLASDAAFLGQRYFEFFRQSFAGMGGSTFSQTMAGTLVSVQCNVINPGATASATFGVSFYTYDSTNNFASDLITLVTFNVGVAGSRTVTTTSFAGKTGTDGVTVNNSAVSYLPANRVTGHCGAAYITGAPASNLAAPMFELIIQTSCGLARKIVTADFFLGNLASQMVIPTQGLLQ